MSHKKFTPNNNNNRLVGPPRGKSLDGQAPTYSTMQVRTLKLSANVNTVNENDDNNKVIISNNVLKTRDNSSWTTLLALHRVHPLLLPPLLILMINALHIYGTTI